MADIVEAVASGDGLPYYVVADTEIGPGASLGSGHAWINTGTDGRIHSLFSTDVGEEVAGPLIVRYASAETRVSGSGRRRLRRADVPLSPVGAGRFLIHPFHQQHAFSLPGGIEVEETVFLPRVPPGETGDETVAYYMVSVRNGSDCARDLSVYAFARLGGSRRKPVISGEFDEKRCALFAWEEEQPDWVRSLTATRHPVAHAITDDLGRLYDTDVIRPFEDDTAASGDVMGCLEVHVELEPGAEDRIAFILAFTSLGRKAAEGQVERLRDVDAVFHATMEHVREELSDCQVMTPDPVINQGAFWCKVNMLRVLAHYAQGEAFTNEPGVSSNIVARDVIWYVYGCDHFQPEVSRRLLDGLARCQYESGKIPEYYNARTGEVADYDLNINDATPLFVLGVNHHVRSTGDTEFLEHSYDAAARASDYILSQRDERGLVFCSAEGEEVWGICSWRNVIPNYQINGAVTEVNAECAAALRAMGHMAENTGRKKDAQKWRRAADALTAAINEHLLDRERELYVLNADTAGRRHTDVTADEIFPVLFRISDEDVAFRIIRRLNSPDFWTEAGLRTCSRLDPLYDPTRYVGLLGGVWPGLTWWYAFAAARYHPEFMVRGLHASYAHYNRHPRVYNTVPGQFSEWFDGESLINRGMRLSPWEPPRFLWAAVEGVCGIMVSPGAPAIRPLIPADWKWCAAVRVSYHGGHLTAFAGRRGGALHVYANVDFQGVAGGEVLAEDVTDRVRAAHAGMHPVALADGKRVVVAIGSCRDEAMTTPVGLADLLKPGQTYALRQYSSERDEWAESGSATGRNLANLGVRIEAGGYHVLEFTRR